MFLTNFSALISSAEWSDFYNDSEGVLMSFIARSLLLLCNLPFMYADCVVFVTLYTRRDFCSLLCAVVGCCLFYPRCTGFTSDVYLVALFRFFPLYTDLYLQCFRVRLTSGLQRSVRSFCKLTERCCSDHEDGLQVVRAIS